MRRGRSELEGRLNATHATPLITNSNDWMPTMPNDSPRRVAQPLTRAEINEERAHRSTENMMRVSHRTNETTMPRYKTRTKVSTKRTLATTTVDPELLQRYFAATKRDANAQARYSPPIINHRLCR